MEYPTDIKTLKEMERAWREFEKDNYHAIESYRQDNMTADEENDQFQELGGD